MSGTFNHIDVPPTLVSFAVDVAKLKDVVSPELKNTGDKLVWIHLPVDAHLLPEYEGVMETYRKLHEDMQNVPCESRLCRRPSGYRSSRIQDGIR